MVTQKRSTKIRLVHNQIMILSSGDINFVYIISYVSIFMSIIRSKSIYEYVKGESCVLSVLSFEINVIDV